MTTVSGVGHPQSKSTTAATTARDVQAALNALRRAFNPSSNLDQDTFKQIDTNGDGKVTKAEIEAVITSAGGSKQSADALYAKLDPKNTGSVTEQEFAARIGQSKTSKDAGSITALSKIVDPTSQLMQDLFTKIDSNGNGTISKSELEATVSAHGGTTADADALYAQLDPNNTGAVTGQQLADNLKSSQKAGFVTSLTV